MLRFGRFEHSISNKNKAVGAASVGLVFYWCAGRSLGNRHGDGERPPGGEERGTVPRVSVSAAECRGGSGAAGTVALRRRAKRYEYLDLSLL